MPHNPQTYRFFLITLDPVHVGTGGMRLGRVDNPIVREPGTRIPKIPGTALHGAIRAYAAHRYGKPQCAGQGKTHCGRPTCPICYTFGYARDQEGGSSGVVAIGDARILLFPVYSMVGPVWVTCPNALYDAGFRNGNKHFEVDKDNKGRANWSSNLSTQDHLNLGWLMVNKENDLPNLGLPEQIPAQIRNRVVLVSDKLFSQIVNSNLEVRTSVAINPETGAAEERALFTYEAIPRATVLWMDVVESDFRGKFPDKNQLEVWEQILTTGDDGDKESLLTRWRLLKNGETLQKDKINRAKEWLQAEKDRENGQEIWKWEKKEMQNVDQNPIGIVQAGLQWVEHLGVGGMGTRGFGRIREITHCLVKQDTLECNQSNAKSKNQNNNSGGKDVGNNS